MLPRADAQFFTRLESAAFANPFGEDRRRIDRELAEAPDSEDDAAAFTRLLARVRARLDRLPDRVLDRCSDGERPLLERALLFDEFHRVSALFDALIVQQLHEPDSLRPLRAPFGRATVARLVSRGFSSEAAGHAFALFYQLRRAFHFIGQTLPGQSPSMRRLRERLWANVFTNDPDLYSRVLWKRMEDFSTILLGETGTGKGIAAAAIGRSGWIPYDAGRDAFAESFVGSFQSLNLAQFPEALLESELFGHKKGAFTGAVADHPGVFARASVHGAIFLDEIGEVGIPVQIKLLRVLQERTFSPVGGHEVARFSGRVIAATHRPLEELRARGEFRDDFYYRLCSDVIRVPSLATRLLEDPRELDLLLAFILERILGENVPAVLDRVRAVIAAQRGPAYPWPGNVRELEQCVRRVLLSRDATTDVPTRAGDADADAALLTAAGDVTAKGLLERYCRALYERLGTYEEVARRTGLDRRTVKAYVMAR